MRIHHSLILHTTPYYFRTLLLRGRTGQTQRQHKSHPGTCAATRNRLVMQTFFCRVSKGWTERVQTSDAQTCSFLFFHRVEYFPFFKNVHNASESVNRQCLLVCTFALAQAHPPQRLRGHAHRWPGAMRRIPPRRGRKATPSGLLTAQGNGAAQKLRGRESAARGRPSVQKGAHADGVFTGAGGKLRQKQAAWLWADMPIKHTRVKRYAVGEKYCAAGILPRDAAYSIYFQDVIC